MGPWTSKSSALRQSALAVAAAAVGILLIAASRRMSHDSVPVLALGVLLLALGLVGALMTARQTVVVDPALRRITVEDSTMLGTKKRTIAFDEVVHVGVGFLGKRSNFVTMYYLALTLTSGEEYPLFAPGRFFAGATDRAVVEGWRQRLAGYLAPR